MITCLGCASSSRLKSSNSTADASREKRLKFTPSGETVAPRGAAFPLVVAIEGEYETYDEDTVVAMFACAFLRHA